MAAAEEQGRKNNMVVENPWCEDTVFEDLAWFRAQVLFSIYARVIGIAFGRKYDSPTIREWNEDGKDVLCVIVIIFPLWQRDFN
jgi:hypothetical protein